MLLYFSGHVKLPEPTGGNRFDAFLGSLFHWLAGIRAVRECTTVEKRIINVEKIVINKTS